MIVVNDLKIRGKGRKMKKICYITTRVGTLRSFVFPTIEKIQADTDWDISVISDGEDTVGVPETVHFFPVSMKRGISVAGVRAMIEMYKIFRREKFDMIQYSTPNASLYASIAGWLARVPVRLYCEWGLVYVGMSGIMRKIFKLEEKLVCRLSTWIEPDSNSNLRFAHSEGLYLEEKGSVVGAGSACGVRLDKFDISRKPEYREAIRRELNIPEDAFVYGFVGRVTKDKGINELLVAFKKDMENNGNNYLIIVGRIEGEKELNQELFVWSKSESHIFYTGVVNDVERYLSAMDCFLLPSYREGFGLGTVEAEAMELPVIVTRIPGPMDAMIPNITGKMISKGSSDELYDAMIAIRKDDYLLMGKKAREFVVDNFEQSKLVDLIVADRIKLMNDVQKKSQK